MKVLTKQAIGFGIAMALIFAAGSNGIKGVNGIESSGGAILLGIAFGAGFYALRKRQRPD
jgi:hypothetical protein